MKKEKWTQDKWVQFGNEVKAVRRAMIGLLMDFQTTANKTDIYSLSRAIEALDKAKHSMECVAVRQYPAWGAVTKVFYGDPLNSTERTDTPMTFG